MLRQKFHLEHCVPGAPQRLRDELDRGRLSAGAGERQDGHVDDRVVGEADPLPAWTEHEFRRYLTCGIRASVG